MELKKKWSFNQLLKNYLNDREKRDREIGRYWASEVSYIMQGKTLPEDFFKEREPFTPKSCRNIIEGEIREEALGKLLEASEVEFEAQPKIVLELNGFQLVVVADFMFEDRILECKSPTNMPDKIEYYYKPQLEAQYRAFNKDVYIGFIKERFEHKFFKYTPSDELWAEMLFKLRNFHEKVLKLSEGNKKSKVDQNKLLF